MVVADHYDDYVKLKNKNEKLKKDLESYQPPTLLSLRHLVKIMTWLLTLKCLEKRTRDSRWKRLISPPVWQSSQEANIFKVSYS
jgi:hypothetical protein